MRSDLRQSSSKCIRKLTIIMKKVRFLSRRAFVNGREINW